MPTSNTAQSLDYSKNWEIRRLFCERLQIANFPKISVRIREAIVERD
ncbi:MAG: hypothetical protein QXN49_08485 [Archaeoglobaceae archaeon]